MEASAFDWNGRREALGFPMEKYGEGLPDKLTDNWVVYTESNDLTPKGGWGFGRRWSKIWKKRAHREAIQEAHPGLHLDLDRIVDLAYHMTSYRPPESSDGNIRRVLRHKNGYAANLFPDGRVLIYTRHNLGMGSSKKAALGFLFHPEEDIMQPVTYLKIRRDVRDAEETTILDVKVKRFVSEMHLEDIIPVGLTGMSSAPLYTVQKTKTVYVVTQFMNGPLSFIPSEPKYFKPYVQSALLAIQNATFVIDFLNSRGMIHRDIKPDNLLVRWHGVEVVTAEVGDAGFLANLAKITEIFLFQKEMAREKFNYTETKSKLPFYDGLVEGDKDPATHVFKAEVERLNPQDKEVQGAAKTMLSYLESLDAVILGTPAFLTSDYYVTRVPDRRTDLAALGKTIIQLTDMPEFEEASGSVNPLLIGGLRDLAFDLERKKLNSKAAVERVKAVMELAA
ncbi:MAG: hypothetical protein MRY21_08360 [Simkaniaceae bacterium]|nr:hypothetical protein [Simkaniaceae bacterium]